MKRTKKRKKLVSVTEDVAAIRDGISQLFQRELSPGLTLYNCFGVYVFFDYDNEPIYVGQTHEGLGSRVGRHLTNQRTDAVAMNVLDPFEVAYIEVFPLYHKKSPGLLEKKELKMQLQALEYAVFQKVLQGSALGAVLNEKDVAPTDPIELPPSFKQRIIPDELFEKRKHPDVRIARRASTIARLAQVISERDVSVGLRRTLLVQARRLERLAAERFAPFANEIRTADPGEETGERID